MNRRERYHVDAVRFHRSLGPSAIRITSWGIISETYTWLRYHTGYRQAERWLRVDEVLESRGSLEVVFPSASTELESRRILSRFADQDLSYVDGFSLHILRSRGDIDAVFAFDHHLTLAGVPVFPSPLSYSDSRTE